MGQTGSVAAQLFNQEVILDVDCYDGYIETVDAFLGRQKYIRLKPGCNGRIEASEDFGNGIVVMISVQRDNTTTPRLLRLSHDGQSLGNIPSDKIYILSIVNGVPSVPSLDQLNELYIQQEGSNTLVTDQGPILINGYSNIRNATLVNAVYNANRAPNAVITAPSNGNGIRTGGRRIGGCACKK